MGPTFTRAKQKKNSKYVPQDLGLEESNKGVFDGSWKGSGEVKYYQHCVQVTTWHHQPKDSKDIQGKKYSLKNENTCKWKHYRATWF